VRTTRSVSTTEEGAQLLELVGQRFDEIDEGIAELNDRRELPMGNFRISATDYVADAVLWPKLAEFLPKYPDISVEVNINYGLVDIVADRYDAGVRFGDQVAKDMIAVRISPDVRMGVFAAPSYLQKRGTPQHPNELPQHSCVNLRLPTHGGMLIWEFVDDDKVLNVHVSGQLIYNSTPSLLRAAVAGFGLTYLPANMAKADVAAGKLVEVLERWSPVFPGHHLYYPSRRMSSRAFALLVNALRHEG